MPNCVRLALTIGFLLLSAGCQGRQDVSPGLEPQQEDFARARKGFKTKLVRQGPSPQPGNSLQTPSGATEIDYRSGDLILTAFVTPDPGDDRRHPAVLFLHGGFAFGGDDWDMPQPYRDAGYVVMIPILRGENGRPGSYTMFYDEVDDVLGAADCLASLPYVDAKRIFVSGHSAGGTLAMLAAMASDRFRAAVSLSGSPDQKANAESQPILISFDRSDPREFQLRSPVAYATSFKCAMRMYFGNQEGWAVVPTQRTATLAKRNGLDVDAIEVSGDHFSSVPEAIRLSIEFFKLK
ncbi:MAG: alpha/beta hydrolase family protein [Isosphaerales bacterium]